MSFFVSLAALFCASVCVPFLCVCLCVFLSVFCVSLGVAFSTSLSASTGMSSRVSSRASSRVSSCVRFIFQKISTACEFVVPIGARKIQKKPSAQKASRVHINDLKYSHNPH
jgi:hypothetical protein